MLYLISLLSFLLPTQLAYHLDLYQSTVYGFKIDYLIPTLYLTDVVVMVIIAMFLYGRSFKINRKYIVYCILYIGFAFTNILYSTPQGVTLYYIPTLYRWFKITEMLLLGVVLVNTKQFDIFKNFIKPLSYSVLIACVLGIWQFINKGSVGGIFYLFGEREFLFGNPNIAPYPYSFFSHPNSFAGFLLVFGIFLIQFKSKFSPKYFWTILSLVAVNIVLTNSLNVYITILLLLILNFKKYLAFGFLPDLPAKLDLSFDFSQRFVTHRLELIQASWKMIKSHFWFGVGLNHFIPNLVKVSNTFINAWELQPVHNIFLLVFSEVGVIGLAAFIFLLLPSLYTIYYPLYAILITGLADHYWFTLQQNMLLFTFVLALSKKVKK